MSYPLYSTYAHLWPMLAPLESYEPEMVEWSQFLEERGPREPQAVLDLGTGGGHHLYHLRNLLPSLERALAVDLSEEMLSRVSDLMPQAECLCQDMTQLSLGERFPLVTVHDSFCYLTELSQVRALFETVAAHLLADGLALVKVDAVADSFEGPYRYLTDFEAEDFDLTLTHYEWDPDPNDTQLQVVYLFMERSGRELQVREERHELGLFSREQLLRTAESVGLQGAFRSMEQWDEERENLVLLLQHSSPD